MFSTLKWSQDFTQTLKNFEPSHVGVTGPNHKGGKIDILTYDFTHRTHIDIHGFYYPRHFTDAFADGWITNTYEQVKRCTKSPRISLTHTMRLGRRYEAHEKLGEKQSLLANQSAVVIREWMNHFKNNISTNLTSRNDKCEYKVISYSLVQNQSTFTAGALRNLMLAKRLLPDWEVRYYVGVNISTHITQLLSVYGANILYVSEAEVKVPPPYWAYLVADDPKVSRFLVRNVIHRLSPRQTHLIKDWERSDYAFHNIRDRPWHSAYALVPYMFGARRDHLRKKISGSMADTIVSAINDGRIQNTSSLLNNVIWPEINHDVMSHDSVSSDRWKTSIPITKLEYDFMKIGQPTSPNEEDIDEQSLSV